MSFPYLKFDIFSQKLIFNIERHLQMNFVFIKIIGLETPYFESVYVDCFQSEFSEYMNDSVKEKLMFAGKNLSYSLYAYISTNPTASEVDILLFVREIINYQLKNFLFDYDLPEWCDESFEDLENQRNDYETEKGDETVLQKRHTESKPVVEQTKQERERQNHSKNKEKEGYPTPTLFRSM